MVRWLRPQVTLSPRWAVSAEYGWLARPGTTMVHELPGSWRFRYTINELGHRGPAAPVEGPPERRVVVVLGDSNAFGTGVGDGEEFAAVLGRALGPPFAVVNLALGGWGLGQEVRRYYEVGARYRPETVILQFCANDPRETRTHGVARVERGAIEFQDSRVRLNPIARRLTGSPLQRSQLYNFLRGFSRRAAAEGELEAARGVRAIKWAAPPGVRGEEPAPSPLEAEYVELLDCFARDLASLGVRLVIIAVEDHLARFPAIESGVRSLDAAGTARWVDVAPWLAGRGELRSPEGHPWGREAHRLIGEGLAEAVRAR